MTPKIERSEATMECRDVRNVAEAFVADQVMVETAGAVVGHLERCPSCRADIEGRRRLRSAVRAAFNAAPGLAPRPEFVANISSRLRAEAGNSKRGRVWSRTWLALAASLLVVAGGLELQSVGIAGFASVVQAAVHDHRFCYLTFKGSDPPIPLEEAALRYDDPSDRLLADVEPSPTALSGGPVRILRRHSCVYDNRRFVHIVLQYRNTALSLVVTPDDRVLAALPRASAPADGSVVSLPSVDGLHVAAFRGPQHAVFLIGSLSDDDLRDVATAMAPGVSKALRGK
jgi:anti-sigma factor RsiW